MPFAELSLTLPIVDVAPTGDADLVARLRQRERTAVAEAYTAHHAPVRAFARRLLGDAAAAEDVVHNTFLALPDAVARFRGASTAGSAPPPGPGAQAPTPDAIAARRQLADRLSLALDELAHDHRVAFVLCEVEERSAIEVAQILDVPEGTIRSRVFHARRRLRELLAAEAPRG